MKGSDHLTTRRGFVATLGFGGVSLYGLWVGYGAAPGPLALFQGESAAGDAMPAGNEAMAEHGMGPSGPTVEEFRASVADFIDRFTQDDGSVYPKPQVPQATALAMPGMEMPGMEMGAAMHDGSAMADGMANPDAMSGGHHDVPVDVYMLAEKWYYEPTHLRLDAGTEYRFRLMTVDVPHGMAIQFGRGARITRLTPNTMTEVALTFDRPGSYLIYCTAYCGAGHDAMQARIDVM